LILAMNNGERAPDPPRWDYLAEEHRRTASRGGAGAQREQCVDDGHGRREFPWEGPRRATMYQSSSRSWGIRGIEIRSKTVAQVLFRQDR
jgi:hypothetical protein